MIVKFQKPKAKSKHITQNEAIHIYLTQLNARTRYMVDKMILSLADRA